LLFDYQFDQMVQHSSSAAGHCVFIFDNPAIPPSHELPVLPPRSIVVPPRPLGDQRPSHTVRIAQSIEVVVIALQIFLSRGSCEMTRFRWPSGAFAIVCAL
jgi:hypothetical protein